MMSLMNFALYPSLCYVQSEISSLELKLVELRRERTKLREGIAAEEGTIAAVKEELAAEQLQLDREREQIELRDTELKEEEVCAMEHTQSQEFVSVVGVTGMAGLGVDSWLIQFTL